MKTESKLPLFLGNENNAELNRVLFTEPRGMPLELPPSVEVGAFLGRLVIADIPTILEKFMICSWVRINFEPMGPQIFGEVRREAASLI